MADFNERVKPQIFAQTLAAVVFHHESYNFFETDEDFKKSENWIIQILALFFERRIELISIIDEEDRQVNQKHLDKCWYIFCIRAGKESVYVSTKVAWDCVQCCVKYPIKIYHIDLQWFQIMYVVKLDFEIRYSTLVISVSNG